jgi:hypothetical protein
MQDHAYRPWPIISGGFDVQDLMSRKEYLQYYIDKQYDATQIDQELYKNNSLILHSHQLFCRNLLNPVTSYDVLLLKHSTGTGKTIASLSIAVEFIKLFRLQKNQNSRIFIIGYTKEVFRKELLSRVEFGFISKQELEDLELLRKTAERGTQLDRDRLTEYQTKLKRRLTNHIYGGYYEFLGYKEFFNKLLIIEGNRSDLGKLSEAEIWDGLKSNKIKLNIRLLLDFCNSFVIFDEIDNTYNSIEINNNGIAIRILFMIFNNPNHPIFHLQQQDIDMFKGSILKAVLMSATPINTPAEICDLINILAPISEIIKVFELPDDSLGLQRSDLFIDKRKFKPETSDKLRQLLMGRISFLVDDNPRFFPKKIFEGEQLPISKSIERAPGYTGKHIPYIKIVECKMQQNQLKVYEQYMQSGNVLDPTIDYILLDMILPSPDSIGVYKNEHIKELQYASVEWLKQQNLIVNFQRNQQLISGDFMKYENLKRWSSKYYHMMSDIFHNLKHDQGKIIISHQYVRGSGILMIQEILKINGIIDQISNPNDNTLCSICGNKRHANAGHDHEFKAARYILYYGEIDTISLQNSLDKYKSSSNINGYEYRILLGSKIINASINTNAVQNIYIMHYPVDFPTMIQLIGRGARKMSHKMLPLEKQIVRIRIYCNSLELSENDKQLYTYEELRYCEGSQDYYVIQQIDKIMNEVAIDSLINRKLLEPSLSKNTNDLGHLYFKALPDPFNSEYVLPDKPIEFSSFNVHYNQEEISLILYIVKRLFIEVSPAWKLNDLWSKVIEPGFNVYMNSKLLDYENFLIVINFMLQPEQTTNKSINYISEVLNSASSKIIDMNNREFKLIINDDFIMMMPVENRIQKTELGDHNYQTSINNLQDNWHKTQSHTGYKRISITAKLKSSMNYDKQKYNFFMQYQNYDIQDMPTSFENYSIGFHVKLIEDCVLYAFNVLTNPNANPAQLHNFYFKMLYFYDKLGMLIFAESIRDNNDIYNRYNKYCYEENEKSHAQKKFNDFDQRYNHFLMSSFEKSLSNFRFDISKINNILGISDTSSIHPKIEDIELQIPKSHKIRKVSDRILPIGHFMEYNGGLSVVKLIDTSKNSFVYYGSEMIYNKYIKENDIIVGYYEQAVNSIKLNFKTRPPGNNQDIKDNRHKERGVVCEIKKKHEIMEIANKLGITSKIETDSIKNICNEIKLELIFRELKAEREYRRDPSKPQIKWFYMFYEKQLC